jgi:hypothetical protein
MECHDEIEELRKQQMEEDEALARKIQEDYERALDQLEEEDAIHQVEYQEEIERNSEKRNEYELSRLLREEQDREYQEALTTAHHTQYVETSWCDRLDFDAPKPPDHYICPITNTVMTNPLMDSDGNCYEKDAILKYLKHNNNIGPLGKPIQKIALSTNNKLKIEIAYWKRENGI